MSLQLGVVYNIWSLLLRTVMPVALFTLYQRDSSEGIIKHFSSLIKVVLDSKSLITVWKMPVSIWI